MICRLLFPVLCGYLGFFLLPASGQAAEDVFELSLEELLSAEVSIASKREEDFLDAPGVVSVITEDQIRRYGAATVGEVIDRFPSVMKTNLFTTQESYLQLRGEHAAGLDGRVLLMINGRPLREYFAGGVNHLIYLAMPVSAVKRIEMIRGPGSVLYGSNAFAGAINLVMKSAQDMRPVSLQVSTGTYNTKTAEASHSVAAETWSGQTTVRARHTDGWDYEFTDSGLPGFGIPALHSRQDNGYQNSSLYSQWRLEREEGQAGIDVYYADMTADTIGADAHWPGTRERSDRGFVNVFWEQAFGEHWQWRHDLTYNTRFLDFQDAYASQTIRTYNVLYESMLHGQIGEGNLVVGLSANELRADERVSDRRARTGWYSFYGQLDYPLGDALKLIAGLQANKAETLTVNFSPRLGAVYQLTPSFGSKLLYSEAFRSASWTEAETDIPGVFKGNDDLKPETISTIDWQWFYRSSRAFYAVSFFYSELQDIFTVDPTVATPTNFNRDKNRVQGGELEWRSQLSANWEMEGSISWQKQLETLGVTDFRKFPDKLVKIGVSYQPRSDASLSLFNIHVPRLHNPYAVQYNPNSRSHNYLTIHARASFAALFGVPGGRNQVLSLMVTNALEHETLYQPDEFIGPGNNTFPWKPGRAAYLGYEWSY